VNHYLSGLAFVALHTQDGTTEQRHGMRTAFPVKSTAYGEERGRKAVQLRERRNFRKKGWQKSGVSDIIEKSMSKNF
jgi:hypothetical protein